MYRNALVALALSFVASCDEVAVHKCVNGAEGIEAAAAYVADHWPDAQYQAAYLLVDCKPQAVIESSISSCARARVKRPESCAVLRRAPGARARIDISHDEDAAISVCHELQHMRDAVWFTDDGCQSHEMTCNYNADAVAQCEDAVFQFRGE
jgi:hypothetical protein